MCGLVEEGGVIVRAIDEGVRGVDGAMDGDGGELELLRAKWGERGDESWDGAGAVTFGFKEIIFFRGN